MKHVETRRDIRPGQPEVRALRRRACRRRERAEAEAVGPLEELDCHMVAVFGILRISNQVDIGWRQEELAIHRAVDLNVRRMIGNRVLCLGVEREDKWETNKKPLEGSETIHKH